MGRVRTKTVKRAGRQIVEKYYSKLTGDFQINKKIAEEVAMIPSKRLRNKIAGYVTHVMKRIKRGSAVRGISLKLQEAEREKKQDVMPERSVTEVDGPIVTDKDTAELLKRLKVTISVTTE
eukprot:Protomagalhaensia_sp_Gyna_25__2965@NODE_2745_length_913_cov_1138_450801_g2268_i1_p1_GENE_NODE_2745_length_913_cov_1138_450801_g2268_i1NODE_2745_length_913_cov_1138_450801_g2268_i1_p1_ORF_typecomplete_len121_score31_06Ribosomal_S17e/PF00833_18/2_7e43NRBF2_MIT/PF17169_4/0_15_NODE_2745_length_913_cov_1138_450801_g2268_i1464826